MMMVLHIYSSPKRAQYAFEHAPSGGTSYPARRTIRREDGLVHRYIAAEEARYMAGYRIVEVNIECDVTEAT